MSLDLRVILGFLLLAGLAVGAGQVASGAEAGNAEADAAKSAEAARDARQPVPFIQLPAEKDADGDYLMDEFETALINAYAPFFVFHPSETAWPSNASHHLASSLALRRFDREAEHEATTDSSLPNPKTWADVLKVYDNSCGNRRYKPEHLYFALPYDITLLRPGEAAPDCPDDDFRVERSGEKSIADVYKARVSIPQHRPANLQIEVIDEKGDSYQGTHSLPIFSSDDKIQDSADAPGIKLACGTKEKLADLKISGLRNALGLAADAEETGNLPNGTTINWAAADVTVTIHGATHLKATFIPPHGSSRRVWIKEEGKACAFIASGSAGEAVIDKKAVQTIWQGSIPRPEGDAEVYAHVYPTANFIVIQYWLFFGYSGGAGEEREGDWGDRIDVVLYRSAPKAAAAQGDTGPQGAMTAYRENKPLTQRMVAMVSFGGVSFKRDPKNAANIIEHKGKLSIAKSRTLSWQGGEAGAGTHPIAYVAKGSHQLHPQGGVPELPESLSPLAPLLKLVMPGNNSKDVCAEDAATKPFGAENDPVRGMPQTTPAALTGSATYKIGKEEVKLTVGVAKLKLVNVGELSSSRREAMMRNDGKVNKALSGAWGHKVASESEADAVMKDEIRGMLRKSLEAKIKETLAALKEAESKAGQPGGADKGEGKDKKPPAPAPAAKKKTGKALAEERVKQIKGKIWKEIVEAKKAVKAKHAAALESDLNDLVLAVIQDVLGINPIKPLLMLSRNKPMAGCEFLDYPGRWGRLMGTAQLSALDRQQAKSYLKLDLPDDDKMMMLRKWRSSGPAGPTGAEPGHNLCNFYSDYDATAKSLLVYGVEVDL